MSDNWVAEDKPKGAGRQAHALKRHYADAVIADVACANLAFRLSRGEQYVVWL